MMVDKNFYTYSSYINFINKMKSLASINRFKDINNDSEGFILRHDVDFDLVLAGEMAKIEHENNVHSTYFILVGCETYNILSNSNREILLDILGMGHEIGLHFDPTFYSEDIEEGFRQEVRLLSDNLGIDIESVSLHQPSLHGKYPSFKGFKNAYDKRYFAPDRYLSDSSMNFRDKDPFSFIENISEVRIMQILIHPMHFSEHYSGYGEITSQVFLNKMIKFSEDFSVNKTFEDDVGSSYLECFLNNVKK